MLHNCLVETLKLLGAVFLMLLSLRVKFNQTVELDLKRGAQSETIVWAHIPPPQVKFVAVLLLSAWVGSFHAVCGNGPVVK